MINVSEDTKIKLRAGNTPKQFSIKVYKADESAVDFTISNDNLVYEQVDFEEKLCSSSQLKFGLCEGSALTFQYFGLPDISGRRLQTYYTVDDETIPMGFFDVSECIRDSLTGKYKVTAYNKLKSDYLDQDVTSLINELANSSKYSNNMTVYNIIDELLKGYKISNAEEIINTSIYTKTATSTSTSINLYKYHSDTDTYASGYTLKVTFARVKVTVSHASAYIWAEINRIGMSDDFYYEIDDLMTQEDLWIKHIDGTEVDYISALDLINYGAVDPISADEIDFADNCRIKGYVVNGSTIIENFSDVYNEGIKTSARSEEINIVLYLPLHFSITSPTETRTFTRSEDGFIADVESIDFAINYPTDMEKIVITPSIASNWSNVTLREIQSSVFEASCQYGKLNRRTNLFTGVELNYGARYPATSLYPSILLHPYGASETTFKSIYKELYTNVQGQDKFRNLYLTYKGLDDNSNEVEKVIVKTVNASGTVDYVMDDNWLFKNLVWSDSDVEDYADAMVEKMQPLKWFPFSMKCAGLPYLETGDMLEIKVGSNVYTSYILERSLSGIHNLQDSYENGNVITF